MVKSKKKIYKKWSRWGGLKKKSVMMTRRSKKVKTSKKIIQIGKGYNLGLKEFIISSAIAIHEINRKPTINFTPECDLFTSDSCFNFNDINIETPVQEIIDEYMSRGYLYLRPYRREQTLIIGCGNNRLDCSNIHNRNDADCDLEKSNLEHNHRDAYTLDLALVANPSIVAVFKKDLVLSKIPDGSFRRILFEGGGDPRHNPEEIKRLLNKQSSKCIDLSYEGRPVFSKWVDGVYRVL
jgi:hypothetical protein